MTDSSASASPSLRLRLRRHLGPLLRRVIPSRLPMNGPYGSYGDALADASGYDTPLVAQQVEDATRAVLEGRAVYERDGTSFPCRPELAIHGVLRQVVTPQATIADFGGGLGGLYINAPELFPEGCRRLVIEQASMVEAGRRICERYELGLHFLDAAADPLPPTDVLVLSSVLQYLPDPWQQLARLLDQCRPEAIVLDRTSVRRGPSLWYLQTNPGYYLEEVTYPIQVLEERRLLAAFRGYRPVSRWRNSFDAGRPRHIGMLLIREQQTT